MADILIVDDDRAGREVLSLTLKRAGYRVEDAGGSKQGLEMARTGGFHLIVLDVMMPEMDGYEVCRRLRATPGLENLLVLILTARSQPVDYEMALAAGADGYLAKPIEPTVLRNAVADLLQKGRRVAPGQSASAAPAPAARPARLIGVFGLRGGAGRTTLAVNLAGALLGAHRRVCLLDLSRNSGHVGLYLRQPPGHGWAALQGPSPEKNLGKAVQRHPSGLAVLPAPPMPLKEGLSPSAWTAVLDTLSGLFDDIVADLPGTMDDLLPLFLRRARPMLLVLTPDVAGVQTTFHTLQALRLLNQPLDGLQLVANQTAPEGALPREKLEQALGRPLLASLPYDPAQSAAMAQSIPLIFSRRESPLAQAVAALAEKL